MYLCTKKVNELVWLVCACRCVFVCFNTSWDAAPYLVLTFWTVLDVEAVVDILEDTGICLAHLASIHGV